MKDFTYKWGEEVREAILDSWHLLYPNKDSKESLEFLVYAFDAIQVNDTSALESLIDEVMKSNPEMVEKAKKNSKMYGWFSGQILKKDGSANPKLISELIVKKFQCL